MGWDEGMSLRDYVAAAALQGQLSNPECADTTEAGVSKWSYKYADAMLKARSQPPA